MATTIRLYFAHFSTNYYISEQRKHFMMGVRLKNQLKSTVLSQLTARFGKIKLCDCPIGLDFTFLSSHKYDVDNYSAMAKYIIDCLVCRGILQDDNPQIVNEIRIRVKKTSPEKEGCEINFFKTTVSH